MRKFIFALAAVASMASATATAASVPWACHVYCGDRHPWDGGAKATCTHNCVAAGGPTQRDVMEQG